MNKNNSKGNKNNNNKDNNNNSNNNKNNNKHVKNRIDENNMDDEDVLNESNNMFNFNPVKKIKKLFEWWWFKNNYGWSYFRFNCHCFIIFYLLFHFLSNLSWKSC